MKLTGAQLTEIRERDARAQEAFENFWDQPRVADDDRHALLAHIAACSESDDKRAVKS
jgi:hypothetical protein